MMHLSAFPAMPLMLWPSNITAAFVVRPFSVPLPGNSLTTQYTNKSRTKGHTTADY